VFSLGELQQLTTKPLKLTPTRNDGAEYWAHLHRDKQAHSLEYRQRKAKSAAAWKAANLERYNAQRRAHHEANRERINAQRRKRAAELREAP